MRYNRWKDRERDPGANKFNEISRHITYQQLTNKHRRHHTPATNVKTQAHSANINCLAFNPFNEFLLATGSSDTTVALWDMRNMAKPMHLLERHSSEAGDGEVCERQLGTLCFVCCASIKVCYLVPRRVVCR